MGLDALVRWLDAAGVPAGTVVVGDEPSDGQEGGVWRIRAVPPEESVSPEESVPPEESVLPDGSEAGPSGGGWEVFWSEGGRRRAWTRFDDESTACFALFGRLAWVRLARGGLVRSAR